MTRSSFAVAAALALTAAPALACPAHGPAADKRALRAIEHTWVDAHDRATLERILADDFRHPVFTGDVLTKQQNIDWLVAHPAPAGRRPTFERLEIRLYGDTALAQGSVVDTDQAGKVLSRNLFTDVFVYHACRWQAVNAQETDIGSPPRN